LLSLDPKNFKNIKSDLIPGNTLLKLAELTKISVQILTSELQQFAIQYDSITKKRSLISQDIMEALLTINIEKKLCC